MALFILASGLGHKFLHAQHPVPISLHKLSRVFLFMQINFVIDTTEHDLDRKIQLILSFY